jgi:hypothetical protein
MDVNTPVSALSVRFSDDEIKETTPQSPLAQKPSIPPNPAHASHNPIQLDPTHTCQDCLAQFATQTGLSNHAAQTQHSPYRCTCGKTFSRLDVLTRHLQGYERPPRYACPHCSKYRGNNAFHRMDHLTQHLRGYHNHEVSTGSDDSEDGITEAQRSVSVRKLLPCPHEGCETSFSSRSEFTKHMRKVHDENLYPCPETGCLRVGGRGFFRKKDLLKHQADHTPSLVE